jgi:acetaldehyde dehydrogenase (acetylating)
MKAVIERAKDGDPTAMRLCIERLIPVRSATSRMARGKRAALVLAPVESVSADYGRRINFVSFVKGMGRARLRSFWILPSTASLTEPAIWPQNG